jgi:hypothetical protein
MENWTAAAGEPHQISQDRLKGCDLCVFLVALHRGHIANGGTQSITQLELTAARERGIEVLVFMLEENAHWPRDFDELDTDPGVRAWRKELADKNMVGFFESDPASIPIQGAVARWLQGTQGSDTGVGENAPTLPT